MKAILDGLFYTLANYSSSGLNVLANIVCRNLISPGVFGAIFFTNGIVGYFGKYNSMYRNAIEREVPIRRARGDREQAESVLRSSYTLLFVSMLVESLVLLVVGLLVRGSYLRWAFVVKAVINLLGPLAVADKITLKVEGRFRGLTLAMLVTSLSQAIMLILLGWLWGPKGYFIALVIGALVQFYFFRFVLKRGWNAYLTRFIDWRITKEVLAIGFAIATFNLLQHTLLTMDRYFVAGYMGLSELGYYSLGSALIAEVQLLPRSLAGSYYPKMMVLLSSGKLAEEVNNPIWKLHVSVVLASAIAFGGIILVLDPLVQSMLPLYAPALMVFKVMVLGGYLYGTVVVSQNIHVGLRRLKLVTLITCGVLGVAFVLYWMLIGYGLLGVAIAMSCASCIYTLAVNFSAERILNIRSLNLLSLLGLLLVGLIFFIIEVIGYGFAFVFWLSMGSLSMWCLTRIHQINWRYLPGQTVGYLFGRG